MTICKGPDGKTSFELTQTDFLDENGSKTYCFTCKVHSRGFAAEAENIWFYRDDLLKFADDLSELVKGGAKVGSVSLKAMSDFSCIIQSSDRLGHFTIETKLESPIYQNSASLMTEAETQTLSNLLIDLEGIVRDRAVPSRA